MFPVAERELRVAARQSRTHRSRLAMASIGVVVFAWMIWLLTFHGRQFSGSDFFQTLSWIAFLYCLFVGVALTADTMSVEKRENTIGLLFLTDLRSFEIVLGKLFASSLTCFFGLFALFPVLAIPLIMGGVQLADFGRMVLSLCNTLFLSMSMGLLISTLSKHSLRATSIALLLMAFIAFGLQGIGELLRIHYLIPEWGHAIELASPFFTHSTASPTASLLTSNSFWQSLLITNLAAWICLVLTCWILPRIWQEKPDGTRSFAWRQRWRDLKFGAGEARSRFRTRMLDFNPFYWLGARERISGLSALLFVTGFVSVAIWVGWRVGPHFGGPATPLLGFVFSWFWTTSLLHLVLLVRVATVAANRFAEDRRAGALELVLATPFEVRRIVRGHWLALIRQMWGPIGAVLLAHGLFLWGLVELFAAEDFAGRSYPARMIVKALWKYGLSGGPGLDWHFVFVLAVMSTLGLLLATCWVTLGWVGMWMGLRAKRARDAPWIALALVLIPPWPIFIYVMFTMERFNYLWTEFEMLYLGLELGAGLALFNNLVLSIWAWRRLRRDFRISVTDRFVFMNRKRSRSARVKLVLRFALGCAAIFSLIKLWYFEEDWRGQRDWTQFNRKMAAKGKNLDPSSVIPPLVPRDQNFGAAPIFASLFDYEITSFGSIHWRQNEGHAKLESIHLLGPPRSPWPKGRPLPVGAPTGFSAWFGNWRSQTLADFKAWQKHFVSVAQLSKLAATNEPSADVLIALSPFSPDLAAMTEAARRPYSQFPIKYRDNQSQWMPHISVVQNIGNVLQLRALARLDLNQSQDALSDLEVIFRFTEALRVEPFLVSQQTRNALIGSIIQVVWEGLAKRRWTDSQLSILEEHWKKMNLIADYNRAIEGDILFQIKAWEKFRAGLEGIEPLKSGQRDRTSLRAFYPVGWTYQHQIQIYRLYQRLIRTSGNGDETSPSIESPEDIWDEIDKKGAFLDNRGFRYALQNAANEFPRTMLSIHLARVAIALERSRLAHGKLPEKLDALFPTFLDALPGNHTDPTEFEYRRLNDETFVLSNLFHSKAPGYATNERMVWRQPEKP